MIGPWPASANFFQRLFDLDGDVVEAARRGSCPHCGGSLDRADYPRKARGIPPESEPLFAKRFSVCCRREGCRRRLTPESVRFFGRRVYAGAVFVMACVAQALAVTRRTLRRWRRWWSDAFPGTPFWRIARARLMPPVDESRLPASLLERFAVTVAEDDVLVAMLRFVAPASAARASFAMGP